MQNVQTTQYQLVIKPAHMVLAAIIAMAFTAVLSVTLSNALVGSQVNALATALQPAPLAQANTIGCNEPVAVSNNSSSKGASQSNSASSAAPAGTPASSWGYWQSNQSNSSVVKTKVVTRNSHNTYKYSDDDTFVSVGVVNIGSNNGNTVGSNNGNTLINDSFNDNEIGNTEIEDNIVIVDSFNQDNDLVDDSVVTVVVDSFKVEDNDGVDVL